MVTFAIIWMSISCVVNVLDAGINIAEEKWDRFIYQMIDAAAYGFVVYVLLTCCK